MNELNTEMQRIQQAKSDIKAAIEEKGVTVGDGTIDTYAEKINKITGEDGFSPIIEIIEADNGYYISITDINGTQTFSVNHGQDGTGVAQAEINQDGELVIIYSNGEVVNLGKVIGTNGKDAVIDQTYSSTSENAQSGKAVAQGLANYYTKDEVDDFNTTTKGYIDNELLSFKSELEPINITVDPNGIASHSTQEVYQHVQNGGRVYYSGSTVSYTDENVAYFDYITDTGVAGTFELTSNKKIIQHEHTMVTANNFDDYLSEHGVDFTDYVKYDNYATGSKGGTIKTNTAYGLSMITTGSNTKDQYDGGNDNLIISKGTLENVLAELRVDYIVEEGATTVDNTEWTWEKWNSGKAVCYGVSTQSIAIGQIWNSPWCYGDGVAITYPFEFVEPPICDMQKHTYTALSILEVGANGTTKKTKKPRLLCSASRAAEEFNISFYATGKWK